METVLMASARRRAHRNTGFTLLEILVALVIVTFGLLGLAALHVRVQQASFEAYNRAQALVLLEAMVSRINANRYTAPCYAITGTGGTPYLGVADSGYVGTITCSGYGDPGTQQLAVNDLTDWDATLRGTTERIGAANAGGALGARGCVSFDATTSTYTVAVAWQGLVDGPVPANACGANRYGAEAQRRVIWTTLKIATLT